MPLWVVVTRTQLSKLAIERNQGRTIRMSAMKSGMSRNTGRKYLRQNDVTEQRRVPHTWRTREDPLSAIWPRAEEMLRQAPELEAKALFEHLATGRQDEIKPGLLRTFHLLEKPGTFLKDRRIRWTIYRYMLLGRRRNASRRLQKGPKRQEMLERVAA